MKILLYEPRQGGHRPVIRNYIQKAIVGAGHSFYSLDSTAGDGITAIVNLNELARREHCDIIHILTADDHVRSWAGAIGRFKLRSPKPIVVNYYLYSNLERFAPGVCWDLLCWRLNISKIFISNEYMADMGGACWRRRRLWYLPDPWDSSDFKVWEMHAARMHLSLPQSNTIMMIFGDISARKGADLALKAFLDLDLTDSVLLLVGKVSSEMNCLIDVAMQDKRASGRVVVRNGHVPEQMVSAYFFAADYVLCTYPRWFSVSSGTFTRACAAGRPVIAAEHGVVGRMVKERNIGITFESENVESLRAAFSRAVVDRDAFDLHAMEKISIARELHAYGKALIDGYSLVLENQ